MATLILVLGDQLTLGKGALRDGDPNSDVVLMAEVAEEAQYVRHNRHKLAFIFSAMVLPSSGFTGSCFILPNSLMVFGSLRRS